MRRSNLINEPPNAIIIGLDSITGLQTARILFQRGIPVIGIAKDLTHFCCKTNVCAQILETRTDNEELISTLERLRPTLKEKAVLFPCSDIAVLVISRYRDRLQAGYHIVLPAADVIEMMIDKVKFYRYARESGFPIPDTYFLSSRGDAEKATRQLGFPAILKPPYRSDQWRKYTKEKAFKVANPGEFLAVYDRICQWVDVLIAQEWVKGTDLNHITCNCYFGPDSESLVAFTSRKLRQWPLKTGQGCYGEAYLDDNVVCETVRLYKSVGFHGLAYLEMKRDEDTGKYFIIEPNVGRPTGRSATAEANGVELIFTMYCDAVGWGLPANRKQKEGNVKWIYLRQDLQSVFYSWRNGELTLRDWWRSIHGRTRDAVFSWTDPAPFWHDFWRTIRLFRKSKLVD
jgi:predicted ATP-grasp superfamily ATP-dependent carboligase